MSRQMKESSIEWIGEIPQEWDCMPIKYVAIFQPRCNTSHLREDSEITYAPMECLKKGYFEQRTIRYGDISTSLTPFLDGDIAIAKVTPCFENGNIAIMDCLKSGFGVGSSEIFIYRPKSINTKFLFYWLQNDSLKQEACATMTGTGGLKRVSPYFAKNCYVLIPPEHEQQSIADYLDRKCAEINRTIAETEKTIEEYKVLKQSIITEAVTRGVRGKRAMKDSGMEWIGEIPEEWDVVRLKSMFDFGKGLPITKENLAETGIPVISYGQIHSKLTNGVELQTHLFRYVDDSYLNSNPQSLVHKGDFIFADTSEDLDGCGNAVYVSDEMILFAGYHTIVLASVAFADNKYIAYQFQTDLWRSQIRSRVSGVKVFSISRKILGNATIIMPPQDERMQIVSQLDNKCSSIDRIIKEKQQLLTELEIYKNSLIHEYVTGKKEVI